MPRLADLPIDRKLTLLAAAASAIALAVASASFIAYDRLSFDETIVRRVSGEAEIVATNSATAIVFRDPDAAAATLAALAGEPSVGAAALYAADGTLFATYPASGQPAPPPPAAGVAGDGHVFADGRLIVQRAVDFEGERVGTLVISYGLGERNERLKRYVAIVIAVSIASLLAALLVGRAARRAISSPILELAENARAVSERSDFAVRAVPRGKDEVGVLVATFNEMLDGLQRRDADLRRVQEELERRVEERTQLLREAEEANRLKDQFLATLSHELRTPLNAIVGWTALLMQGNLDPATAAKAVTIVDRNARAQTKLIEDVLDVSRIVSGKLHMSARTVDPGTVVRAAVESVAHAASAKRIRLTVDVEPASGLVSGDPDRLQQVVWNLLSNAIKFTPAGGAVAVRVERSDNHVAIVVRDTGAGVAKEFLPHVFERFRQADASTTRAFGGLGLGMAIVRHLVELHGGTVRADSRGEGYGATFTITLPTQLQVLPDDEEQEPAVPIRDTAPLQQHAELDGVSVLVVDDDADSRAFVCQLLQDHGARVAGSDSTSDALRQFKQLRPDVLISDIGMPNEDGYALIRRIRALTSHEGAATPAVALTAYVRSQDEHAALDAGYQRHVRKPVVVAELITAVAELAAKAAAAAD